MTLVLIVGQINVKNRLINFNNWIMDYLGKLSYGVYIIHVIVIYGLLTYVEWSAIQNKYVMVFAIYASVIGLTVAFAHFSYHYFEKPFLKLKNRFAVIHSSGTKTFDTTDKN